VRDCESVGVTNFYSGSKASEFETALSFLFIEWNAYGFIFSLCTLTMIIDGDNKNYIYIGLTEHSAFINMKPTGALYFHLLLRHVSD
jgi:hypothetical protein